MAELNGEVDNSIKLYEKVLELDPKDHRAHVNLAIMKEKAGRREEALIDLERAIALNHKDRRIHINLGVIKRN